MAQSEKTARDLEDRLGARRFVAMDFGHLAAEQRKTWSKGLLNAMSKPSPWQSNMIRPAGKSIFADVSKKDMDPMMDLVERVGMLDWQEGKPFRDPLLLLC